MINHLIEKLLCFRRFFLKKIIPEFIWPKFVELRGVQIPIRGAPFSAGNKLTLWKGVYEWPEINQLDFLKEGMNVIEFGSSLGILSAIITKLIGLNGKLISVEASSELVEVQKNWLLQNRTNLTVINGFAFPLTTIPDALKNLKFNPTGGSLCGRVELIDGEKKNTQIDIYSLSAIDEMFENGANCLICDIEGSEEVIINYEFSLPETIEHILIELHPWIYKNETTQFKIIEAIESQGFKKISSISNTFYFMRELLKTSKHA